MTDMNLKHARRFISTLQQAIEDNLEHNPDAAESVLVFLEGLPELKPQTRSVIDDVFFVLTSRTIDEILKDAAVEDEAAEEHDLWTEVEEYD
jgi:hypothetical protein